VRRPATLALGVLALLPLYALDLPAQTEHYAHGAGHDAAHAPALGRVAFPNPGAPAAQAPFLRGVALLHSFEYERAAEAFGEAERADTGFALPRWLEAFTHSHLLWGEEDTAAAHATLRGLGATPAARLARARNARERAWGAAIEAFYADTDQATRARGFADSLRAMAARDPRDLEAAAFASLALQMALAADAVPGERRAAVRDEAIALGERVFRVNPRHPGAAHYLIHAYDDPATATRGLPFARVYAAIAPDAEHALHMPSHIFLQVGLWDDVARSNEKAWAASRAEVARHGAGPGALDFHAFTWLEYAYLQQGRWHAARALLDTTRAIFAGAPLDSATRVDARYAAAGLAFLYGFETGRWSDPVVDSVLREVPVAFGPTASPRERFFTRTGALWNALAAAGTNNADAVRPLAATFRLAADSGRAAGRRPGFGTVGALQLDAWLARTAGARDSAIALLRQAAAVEDSMRFVGPVNWPPSAEALGATLLEAGRPGEAAAAYERGLELTPGRSAALLGLARARAAAGDRAGARTAYKQLLANWRLADRDVRATGARETVAAR
jgi:tetratricopeptide (TPR) repeat protein